MTVAEANSIFKNEREPITQQYLELINETMVKNGWSWEEVIEEHQQDPKKAIWRIVSCRK